MEKDNNMYSSFLYNEQDEDLNTRPANTNKEPAKKSAKQISGVLKRTGTTAQSLYLAANVLSTRQVNHKS